MSLRTADTELTDAAAGQPLSLTDDPQSTDDADSLTTVKGIAVVVLVSLPLWGLIAFTLYLLV